VKEKELSIYAVWCDASLCEDFLVLVKLIKPINGFVDASGIGLKYGGICKKTRK